MDFKIIVLGSNSAIPKIDSFSSTQLIIVNSVPYLIDCCEGAQIQLNRFYPKFININHIFISHLHGDHYFGIFGLLSTFNLQNRTAPLHIYSDRMLEQILTNPYSPILINDLTFNIYFHHLLPGFNLIHNDNNVEVFSFPLCHKIPTWGFFFKEVKRPPNIIKEKIKQYNLTIDQMKALKRNEDIIVNGKLMKNNQFTTPSPLPRSFAYCSDTAYCTNLNEYLNDIDLMYHETTFLDEQKDKALNVGHSTPSDAAKAAISTKSKNLLIGHYSVRTANKNMFLQQTQRLFPKTYLAFDGLMIEIDRDHNLSQKSLL